MTDLEPRPNIGCDRPKPKVNQLVWEEENGRIAKTPFGSFSIADRGEDKSGRDVFGWCFTSRGDWDESEDVFTSIREAKYAAQLEWKKRVKECLE